MTDEQGQQQEVEASILLADYVVVDPQGKVNVVGGNVSLIGFDTIQGLTNPFSVWVNFRRLDDGRLAESAAELTLVDASNQLVLTPDAFNELRPLRVAQVVQFRPIAVPGARLPLGAMASTAELVLTFGRGLPLAPGQVYKLVVKADTHEIASAAFYVAGPVAGPVLG